MPTTSLGKLAGRSLYWGSVTPLSHPPSANLPSHFTQTPLSSLCLIFARPTDFGSVQFGSVAQSCPTLCDPMDCNTPGLPVHHQLPEFTQTHVHRVSDAIQPSHPLSSPSPPPLNLPSLRVFSNHSGLRIRWPKYWSFSLSISPSNEYSGLTSFRIDWFDLLAVQGV